MAGLDPLIRQDSLIGGKYRLGPVIGSGGVAAVYRATHLWTERKVAVKLLDPTLPHFERLREGFLREARATVQLDHPHVVDVLDMGEDNSETAYLVMELLEGPTLRDELLERGRLSEEYTLAILMPLVDALEKAHQLGIVHRDLKPENIMLTVDDYGKMIPKLLDFGVAEILEDKRSHELSDYDSIIIGTPQYMSPEQARDESHRVGPHSDVWAVGVVLYECLTGRVPFVGETAVDVLTAVCEAPIDFEGVPEAYVPLLRDALGRTPDDRIATLSEFKARIEEMGVARPSPPPEPVALSSTRPSSVPSKTNLTLTGLGPGELSSAERISIAADAELESVPVRSHRKALLGGLAVAIVVAGSAWWSVRDFGREPALLLGPSLAEREVLPRLGASDRDIGAEPVEEIGRQATEQVPAEPVEEVTAEPVEEVTAEPVAEVPAEPVAEVAVAPVEEAAAQPTVEVDSEPAEAAAAEPSEGAPSDSDVDSAEAVTETPKATAARPPASPVRPKSRSVRRKKPPSSDRPRSGEPPELVTEW
ncbi:MAG: serine/threonine protein kinase [Deltaproteobacteria bacterium]|nr:serine/threonine protein kinase [Deltaproteobacteria bacterium]MBT8465507.1 serine/threonine protein kinase [Deltaproteobacteria bacterium]NNK08226.1 protein kinase [Myxococcales bacterium]NNK44752.1 protein kinase [Myxococcales bacterium]